LRSTGFSAAVQLRSRKAHAAALQGRVADGPLVDRLEKLPYGRRANVSGVFVSAGIVTRVGEKIEPARRNHRGKISESHAKVLRRKKIIPSLAKDLDQGEILRITQDDNLLPRRSGFAI
jgi:hypothetical protein